MNGEIDQEMMNLFKTSYILYDRHLFSTSITIRSKEINTLCSNISKSNIVLFAEPCKCDKWFNNVFKKT